MRVVCHSRSAAAVKQAVRHGVDIIGHANYLDDEAVDLLREQRHRIFVGPAIAWEMRLPGDTATTSASAGPAAKKRGYEREVEETIKSVRRLRDAGVRVLPGGDYGLNITPHGTYAKDLAVLRRAVRHVAVRGAAVRHPRRRGGGRPRRAWWARSRRASTPTWWSSTATRSPTSRVLQDHDRITAVIKDGRVYRGLTRPKPYAVDPASLETLLDPGTLRELTGPPQPWSSLG